MVQHQKHTKSLAQAAVKSALKVSINAILANRGQQETMAADRRVIDKHPRPGIVKCKRERHGRQQSLEKETQRK